MNIVIKEEAGPGSLLIGVLQNLRCGQYPRDINFKPRRAYRSAMVWQKLEHIL